VPFKHGQALFRPASPLPAANLPKSLRRSFRCEGTSSLSRREVSRDRESSTAAVPTTFTACSWRYYCDSRVNALGRQPASRSSVRCWWNLGRLSLSVLLAPSGLPFFLARTTPLLTSWTWKTSEAPSLPAVTADKGGQHFTKACFLALFFSAGERQ
jgi:hypothetical protein